MDEEECVWFATTTGAVALRPMTRDGPRFIRAFLHCHISQTNIHFHTAVHMHIPRVKHVTARETHNKTAK